MFSIQNQNQVTLFSIFNIFNLVLTYNYKAIFIFFQAILHLSQISAILNPRQTAYLRKKQSLKPDSKQIICQDSFVESVKNFDFSVFKNLNINTVHHNHPINKFNVSYVSSGSFFENKNGFSEAELKSDAIPTLYVKNKKNIYSTTDFFPQLFYSLLQKNNFSFNVQVRNFKTLRNVETEKLRNPSFPTRIRQTLGKKAL